MQGSAKLNQNRVRIFVTVEFKDSNIKRHLAVSEKPEKNIGKLLPWTFCIFIWELKEPSFPWKYPLILLI